MDIYDSAHPGAAVHEPGDRANTASSRPAGSSAGGGFARLAAGNLLRVAKEAIKGWKEDRVASMGAALAYYTAFSIAPLLLVVVGVAGLAFGHDAAQAAVIAQLQDLLGTAAGDTIGDMLSRASDLGTGILAIAVGIGALLLAATTAFVELQDDLDRIWKAEPRIGSGLLNLIKSRLLSFAMVLFIGFLLTVSLALSAGISAMGRYLFSDLAVLLEIANFVTSLAIITVLFALIYKVLPNVDIAWRDVWVGAAVTALLFTIGKQLIGLYIGKSAVASSFGAAGPFVILLLWIYYSTQIFLLGAEFTAKLAQQTNDAIPGARAATRVGAAASENGAESAKDGRRPDEPFLTRRQSQMSDPEHTTHGGGSNARSLRTAR